MVYSRRRRYSRRRKAWWKVRARRSIYDKIGTSNSKVHQEIITYGASGTLTTRTLYSQPITKIQSGLSARDARDQNVINLAGFHMQFQVANIQDTPVCMRMAIVQGRSSAPSNETIDGGDFFRGFGDSRAENFVQTTDTGPISLTYMNNPINMEKYTLLWSYKMLLPNAVIASAESNNVFPGAFEGRYKKSYKTINKYVPIRRQLRFENTGKDFPSDGHLFLICWCDRFLEQENSAHVSALRWQGRVHAYFREGRR